MIKQTVLLVLAILFVLKFYPEPVERLRAGGVKRKIRSAGSVILTYDGKGELLKLGSGFFINPHRLISSRYLFEGAHSTQAKTVDGRTCAVQAVVAEDWEAGIVLLQVEPPATRIKPLPAESGGDSQRPPSGASVVPCRLLQG